MKRLIAAALLTLTVAATASSQAVDATSGVLNNTPLGYLACVQTFPSHQVLCFVATHTHAGVEVTAMTGGFRKTDPNAGRITTATLPADALTVDTTARVMRFAATIPDVGTVDIRIGYTRTSVNASNVGCQVYPVHYALTSAPDLGGLGAFLSTSGTVNGETVASLLEDCDATILRPVSGAWTIDTV
jgi:hypothetical protein